MFENKANHDFAAIVAKHMGNGWAYDKQASTMDQETGELKPVAYITDGVYTLFFDFRDHGSNKPGMVEVVAEVPRHTARGEFRLPYDFVAPKIRCSIRKGADKVARDIERRLLDRAKEVHDEQAAYLETINKADDDQDDYTSELADISGGRVRWKGKVEFDLLQGWADVRVGPNGEATFDIRHVPFGMAKRIAKTIQAYNEEQKG